MHFRDGLAEQFADNPQWASFLPAPATLPDGQEPGDLLPGRHAQRQVRSADTPNKIWNRIAQRINAYPYATSDYCTEKHYRDVFEFIRLNSGMIDRFVECGVFQGGLSVVLAGCALAFDFQLDLIDVNPAALHATYHRIRLTFPEALPRIRIFFGELPNYVKTCMREPDFHNAVLHHDGSHRFNIVMRDLASLYYVRKKLHAVLVQDTHLRHSDPAKFCFVDAALAAVFGLDLKYQPIGQTFQTTTYPQLLKQQGEHDVYFLGGRPEGMMIPMAENSFFYPHALHNIDDFIAFPAPQPA
jgi:hypothetical protein